MVKKKQILISIGIFLAAFFVFFGCRSYFQNHFARIEQKQDQLLENLQKMATQISMNASPSSSLSSVQEIGRLKQEILRLDGQVDEHNGILGLMETASASASPLPESQNEFHFVTIADRKWQKVDVFKEKYSSSAIIGQAIYGQSYPYVQKESGYYYIALTDTLSGWIHSQFVKEY